MSLVKNMIAFVSSGIIAMAVSFLIDIYLARVLGVDAYGQISFAMAATIFVYYFVDFGINYYSTTRVSKDESLLFETIGEIVPLKVVIAMAGLLALSILTHFFVEPKNQFLVILYGLSAIPIAISLEWVFQSVGKLKYIGISKVAYTVSMFALILIFVTGPGGVLLVPVFQLIGLLLGSTILIYVFKSQYQTPIPQDGLKRWPEIVRAAVPYGITGAMTMFVWYVPSLALEYMSGDTAVGYFNAADVLISSGVALIGFYFYSVYPTFVKTRGEIGKVQSYSAKLVITVITPVCAGAILLADQIMLLFYGEEYLPAVPAFQLLALSLWFLCINQIYIFGLFSMEKQKGTVKIFAVQCIATVILCIALIPWLGAAGAAIAAVCCEVVSLPLFHIELRKVASIRYAGNLALALVSTGIMVAAVSLMKVLIFDNLFVSVFVGGIVFFIMAYHFGLIGEEDFNILVRKGDIR